jgi:uncharacterized membrane protein YhiD involved in acid resistance
LIQEVNVEIVPQDVLKVLLALLIGGLVGAERELRDKAAGFQTMIFAWGRSSSPSFRSRPVTTASSPIS